jgi:hypothetical protein
MALILVVSISRLHCCALACSVPAWFNGLTPDLPVGQTEVGPRIYESLALRVTGRSVWRKLVRNLPR